MIKKALIYTEINNWLDKQKLGSKPQDIQTIFDRSRELYEHLKDNHNFPDLLPENLSYVEFMKQMEEGIRIVNDPHYKIFRGMR